MADAVAIGVIVKEVLRQMDPEADPEACLRLARDAIGEGNAGEAKDALASYREWRRRGGFEPKGGDRRACELERMLGGSECGGEKEG